MRISDWSSDVCSSDLPSGPPSWFYRSKLKIVFDLAILDLEFAVLQVGVADEDVFVATHHLLGRQQAGAGVDDVQASNRVTHRDVIDITIRGRVEIGRASCRERVCQYVWI